MMMGAEIADEIPSLPPYTTPAIARATLSVTTVVTYARNPPALCVWGSGRKPPC